jgi:ABC-type multidrug transport system ATPase subunit
MIVAKGVTKRFGRVAAVRDASLEVPYGQSLALWGSNGAGKTTLIRCLLGVTRFKGQATIGGKNVKRRGRAARALVGYVPQELAFHDDARMGSAMAFFAGLRRVDRARAREVLADVGLTGHERKRVRDLSGGMKQRLALAIAMLSDPPVIVLDEPTSNLDAAGRGEVVQTLQRLKQSGKTLVFASHRPDEVISLADTVIVLERGVVQRVTTPLELWPTEKPVQVIRLYLSMANEAEAAQVLRDAGHAVHLNGHGLCVAVPRDRKAEPIGVLARQQIEVRNIEVMDDMRIEEVAS